MLSTLLLLITPAFADCTPVDLAAVNMRAAQYLRDAEAAKALAEVEQAEQNLGCLTELATKDALGTLFRVGGAAALSVPDEATARRLFASAARMTGDLVFDSRLGAPAEKIYREQLDFVRSAPTGTVLAYEPRRLDGWDLPLGTPQAVVPGGHLVQFIAPDGSVQSSIVAVADGEQAPPFGDAPTPMVAPVETHGPRKAPLGLTIAGITLVVAGGACLFATGPVEEELGVLRGEYGYNWPDPAVEDQVRLVRTVNALQGCGVAGLGLGVAALSGSIIISNNTLSFVKTW